MKKRHFVLVLCAIAMASVAFGCKPEPSKRDSDSEAKIIAPNNVIAPKTSEERIIAPTPAAEEQVIAPPPSSEAGAILPAILVTKTPEDRIFVVLNTLHSTVFRATDCDKLVKDLDSYCKGVSASFGADLKTLMPASGFDLKSRALMSIKRASDMSGELEKSACKNDIDVKEALIRCLAPLIHDTAGFAKIETEDEA